MTKIKIILSIFIYLVVNSLGFAQNNSYQFCLDLFKKAKSINTLHFTMEKNERIDSKMVKQITTTKLSKKPYLVYSYQEFPKKGLEVLYSPTKNDGKILVNTNGFPWVNISLNPEGSIARKDQHHTIKDSGYDLVINVLEFLFKKYGEEVYPMLQSQSILVNGVECEKITFTNPNFKYINYLVGKGETVLSVANKYMISEYMILQKNKHLSDYGLLKEGDEIVIPNDYSPKMELIVEKDRMIPISVKVFDDVGVYEYFKYSNLTVNPKFSSIDFDENNSDYGF